MTGDPSPQDASPWTPATVLATWFWSGRLPAAPGTWGSLAALPFAWLLMASGGLAALLAGTAAVFAIGVWAASLYAQQTGKDDPGEVVIDEVAGQWLSLIPFAALEPAVPTLVQMGVGFALFRLFDILKPWPVGLVERWLKGGLGIMADDIAAALYAILAVALLHIFGVLP